MAYLHATRQRLLRLLVLVQWAHKARAVSEISRVLAATTMHTTALRDAADNLAYLHAELEGTAAAHRDVATAMHVLSTGMHHHSGRKETLLSARKPSCHITTNICTGTYDLLPAAIREATGVTAPHTNSVAAIRRLDHAIHRELLRLPPPPTLDLMSVAGGCCTLVAPAQCYRAVLTLAAAPDLSMPLQLLRDVAARQQVDGMDVDGNLDDTAGKDSTITATQQWRWQLVHLDVTAGARCNLGIIC